MSHSCSRCKDNTGDIKPVHQWKTPPPMADFLKICCYNYLCLKCINEIGNKLIRTGRPGLPKSLIDGEHYYIENGKWVFTEKYHLLKGYCCNNGCRHCPYGYKN